MSLAIDVDKVSTVLLPDGKWHVVADGSFETDSYEYVHNGETTFEGGQNSETIPSTGATWKERDSSGRERVIACPLTSIQAVSY